VAVGNPIPHRRTELGCACLLPRRGAGNRRTPPRRGRVLEPAYHERVRCNRLPDPIGRSFPGRGRFALVFAVLAAIVPAASAAAAEAPSTPPAPVRPDLLQAGLAQAGRRLVLTLDTVTTVPLARFQRLPSPRSPAARYLCFAFRRPGHASERRLCLGGARRAHTRVGLELLDASGHVRSKATPAARLRRPSAGRLVLSLLPGDAGLAPHRYRWRVLEDRGDCAATAPSPRCEEESLPAAGFRRFRLRPVRPVGCTGGRAGLVRNGPRGRRAVALSFDDGPSSYTPAFLAVLRREHVHATFFEIGQEVAGRAATMRRILSEGGEIGNHTMRHGSYPGYADLAAADARIRAATHFEPCLFRPPGGAFDSDVVAAAGRAGLTTVLWDVDPADWSLPGSDAIYRRVVGAVRPGSIIIMHDGGGDRGETLAALPAIIRTLRVRGYRFDTVSELLGQRMIYSPYG
jgi:peptidoglycan/xylan/chitin deacetylase (PgdA/CDA1 family)